MTRRGSGPLDGQRRFIDLTKSEKETIRARLPEDKTERLQVYRALLAECRDALAAECSPDNKHALDLSIALIERRLNDELN